MVPNKRPAVAVLEIPAHAHVIKALKRCNKLRAPEAKVLSIVIIKTWEFNNSTGSRRKAYSSYDADFIYRVGQIVKPYGFSRNKKRVCAGGIHFFLYRYQAKNY